MSTRVDGEQDEVTAASATSVGRLPLTAIEMSGMDSSSLFSLEMSTSSIISIWMLTQWQTSTQYIPDT